jgi:hypothetical protein
MQKLTVDIINTHMKEKERWSILFLSLSMRITRMCYLIYRKDQSRSDFHKKLFSNDIKIDKKVRIGFEI